MCCVVLIFLVFLVCFLVTIHNFWEERHCCWNLWFTSTPFAVWALLGPSITPSVIFHYLRPGAISTHWQSNWQAVTVSGLSRIHWAIHSGRCPPLAEVAVSVNSSSSTVCLWCGDRGDVWPHRLELKLRSAEKCAALPPPDFQDFIPVETSNLFRVDLQLLQWYLKNSCIRFRFGFLESLDWRAGSQIHLNISHHGKWKVWMGSESQGKPTASFFARVIHTFGPSYNSYFLFQKIHT